MTTTFQTARQPGTVPAQARRGRSCRPNFSGVPVVRDPYAYINDRIDVSAQRVLISMARSASPIDVLRASLLLQLVKTNAIAGIYQQNQRVPATLAPRTRWWDLLAEGQNSNAACHSKLRGRGPVVFFRKNLPQPLLLVELRTIADCIQRAIRRLACP